MSSASKSPGNGAPPEPAAQNSRRPPSSLPTLRNGQSMSLDQIPELSLEAFREAVITATLRRQRVSALFGVPNGDGLELFAVLSNDSSALISVAKTLVRDGAFASMTPECAQVQLFEREIREQWGVVPEGHPFLKPVRFAPPMRASAGSAAGPSIGIADFYRVEGEEIHEVAVGPVHAGVIEPGHFRFQCHGEQVFHLEISLGYQHRGVERALLGGPNKRTVHYMETAAGDTTVAHTMAYCQIIEELGEARVSGRAHALRAVALELERLANHVGCLGALAGDVGFLPTASFCGRLRGDFLNMTAVLCGSRFGRGMVRPGGVNFDLDAALAGSLLSTLNAVARDVENAIELLWDTASVQARFEGTGPVTQAVAEALGLVGVAARASGLERDIRHDFPFGIFRLTQIPLSVARSGDVFARAYVRWLEVQRSLAFVREQLSALPGGALKAASGALVGRRLVVSLVEGFRGEVCHVALTDAQGKFAAYKLVDPSFHNWMGLSMALRDQQISDFPLCNKSFDLSYCGHDL